MGKRVDNIAPGHLRNMGKLTQKLTQKRIDAGLKKPGRHSDGDGLFFRTLGADRAYFVYRYRVHGVEREMSLGPYPEISLADARAKHAALRKQVISDKADPLAARQAERAKRNGAAKQTLSDAPTFGAMAESYIAAHEKGWKNSKHAAQWAMTLLGSKERDYCADLRNKPVDAVTTSDVVKVLTPIWHEIPETASRLRGRIEVVLDAARALGHIDEDRANPARWHGHLDKLLPKPKKLTRGHHAALEADAVPALMRDLQAIDTVAARATIFTVLTATRTNEALGAKWEEIDFASSTWTVPKDRSKVKKDFRMPLAPEAIAILRKQEAGRGENEHVFPGRPMRGCLRWPC